MTKKSDFGINLGIDNRNISYTFPMRSVSKSNNTGYYSPLGPDRFNMPGVNPISPIETANYWQNNWNDIKNSFGLTDEDFSLILPMILSGASQSELLSYIQSLNASHQTEDKNSFSSQIEDMRSVGYNPDLTGSVPSQGNVEIPSSPFSTSDLPSNGGKGSLSEKFTNVAGLVLKTMSFGLQAYGLVSNSLISTASLLSGFADADALNAIADENGVVTDVNGAIADLIRSRGLSGRKAKQYAGYLSNRINSTLSITGRLRQSSDKSLALYDSKINGFKATDDYTSSVMRFLKATQENQALQSEFDLQIQKKKTEWLAQHPDVTAEQLDMELAGKRDEASVKHSQAIEASNNAAISGERLEQERSNTGAIKDENDVRKLKASIAKIEIEGLNKMIEFCKEFEDEMSSYPKMFWYQSHKYPQYKNYKRQLNEYYYHGKSGSNGKLSVGVPGFGNIGFNF